MALARFRIGRRVPGLVELGAFVDFAHDCTGQALEEPPPFPAGMVRIEHADGRLELLDRVRTAEMACAVPDVAMLLGVFHPREYLAAMRREAHTPN